MTENIKCPTCGEPFGNEHAMAVHHGKSHPDAWKNLLWHYIDAGPPDECWNWQKSFKTSGHGQFHSSPESTNSAHRLVWVLENGQPNDKILHKCGNLACCNPNHLYDGETGRNFHERPNRCPLCLKNTRGLDFHHWRYGANETGCYLCRNCHDSIHQGAERGSLGWLKKCVTRLVTRHKQNPSPNDVDYILQQYRIPESLRPVVEARI